MGGWVGEVVKVCVMVPDGAGQVWAIVTGMVTIVNRLAPGGDSFAGKWLMLWEKCVVCGCCGTSWTPPPRHRDKLGYIKKILTD